MIQKVGFKNFRRFKNFPEMDLGDINIFVGRNNAGKSTVLKALQLMKGNLNTLSSVSNRKNIFASMKPMFVFDVDELAELHIDNFERALYNKADRKEITLSATIDGCSFTIVLDGQNIERNGYYVAVPYNYIELKDENIHLTFDFQTRDLHLKLKKTGNVYKQQLEELLKRQAEHEDAIKNLEIVIQELTAEFHSSEMNQLPDSKEMIEKVSMRQSLESSLKKLRMVSDLTLKQIASTQKDGEEVIIIDIKSLPEYSDSIEVNIIVSLFDNLYHYANNGSNLDKRTVAYKNELRNQQLIRDSEEELMNAEERFQRALKAFKLEYIHAHAASQKVIYLKEDKMDVLSRAIAEFCKAHIEPGFKEWNFIKKWMGQDRFAIGEDFSIEDIQSAGYMLKVFEDGEKMDLADKGTGSIQIMTLLFSLAVIMHKVGDGPYYPTILVEEPEQNIHPMLQSMLADMFLDFWQSIKGKLNKSQLIIETHSEYLIRRTQVLVANEEYESESVLTEHNPFRVYYFEKDNTEQPYYQMAYGINGRFKDSFGTGFYDAAGKLALDLSNHEKTEDNNSINWSVL